MRRTCAAFVGALGHPILAPSSRGLVSARPCALVARRPLRRPHSLAAARPRAHVVALAAQTQQQTAWNVVSVLENSPVWEAHRYLVLDVGTTLEKGSLCDAYRVPGMYVQLRPGDDTKPAFLAISCAPNVQGVFEFLIKDSEATRWLAEVKPGDEVQVSPVGGNGFPTAKLDLLSYPPTPEEDKPLDLLLFATGSGIAPIRAAIESMLNGLNIRQRRSVKLFYGAWYPERMAYMDRFALWKGDGVEVIPVMSRPDESKEPWTGRTGYVQDALKDIGVPHPRQTAALLCGKKEMTIEVKNYLLEQGVPEDRILFNF